MGKKHWSDDVPDEVSCVLIAAAVICVVALPFAIIGAVIEWIGSLF
ncbi:hypothetical protein ACH46F_32635 [Streptomyces virginiae]